MAHSRPLALLLLLASGCDKHDFICGKIADKMGQHDGFGLPGVAGAPRWGIPTEAPEDLKVRRSWSTLTDEEKQHVIDGFLALKRITVDSGDPGSPRANYDSFCEATGQPQYEKNLYDYYVEAHANAFVSMMTPAQDMESMSHMGPQFLPWHRMLLLRIEADMAEALGDPDFALPYWDWTDCYADGDPTTCTPLFDTQFLGSGGGCDEDTDEVEGGIVAQGLTTHIYSNSKIIGFDPASIVCGTRPLRRQVGCSELVDGPPTQEDIDGLFLRPVYDDAPYDSCNTDEDVSFRQYLEGFSLTSTEPDCVSAGCGIHGRGHMFVGGDMFDSTTNPNDPMFFLHHAQVDRMWAAWQMANQESSVESAHVDAGNPGYPDMNRVPLFIWDEVNAEELFDFEGLGYTYDTLPQPD